VNKIANLDDFTNNNFNFSCNIMKKIFFSALLFGMLSFSASAQDFHMPKPSPTTTVNQEFSTSFIKLVYSRPSMKGRVIFGHVVPFGQIWRTGANSATKISFGEDVTINNTLIKAGEYALYTIPEKDHWTIILNTGVSNWGQAGFNDKDDVVKFTVPVQKTKLTQQTFSISVEDLTINSAKVALWWENTYVDFEVKADNNARIMAYLADELKKPNPNYNTVTSYYIRTNQHLEEAVELQKKAIAENPKQYFLYWHLAEIYQKLGKHEEAVKAAKQAADIAKGTAFETEYHQHYLDILNAKKK